MRFPIQRSLLVAGCLAAALPLFSAVEVLDEIVCKVNGEIITRSDLDKDRLQLEAGLRSQGLTGTQLQDAITKESANLLEKRIDVLLLVSKAKEMDLKVDTDLNKRLADYQRASGQADPEKFQEWVVGEMLGASEGIGFMVAYGGQTFQTDTLFVGVLIIGLAGIALSALTGSLEKRFSRWRPER